MSLILEDSNGKNRYLKKKKKQGQTKLLKILPIEEVLEKLSNFEPKQRQGVLYKTFFPEKESTVTRMQTCQIWSIPHNTIISITNLMKEKYPALFFKPYFPTDYDPEKDINFLHRLTLLPGAIFNPPYNQTNVTEKKFDFVNHIFELKIKTRYTDICCNTILSTERRL